MLYLAGGVRRRDEIRAHARTLMANGHDITSRWLKEEGDTNLTATDTPLPILRAHAVRDVQDILMAEGFVMFGNPEGRTSRGCGRHWETGYAWSQNRPIWIVGRIENVFHTLPGIEIVQDMDELLEGLSAFTAVEAMGVRT
jgi:hypothetical protein